MEFTEFVRESGCLSNRASAKKNTHVKPRALPVNGSFSRLTQHWTLDLEPRALSVGVENLIRNLLTLQPAPAAAVGSRFYQAPRRILWSREYFARISVNKKQIAVAPVAEQLGGSRQSSWGCVSTRG
jgi:hypothetical protein